MKTVEIAEGKVNHICKYCNNLNLTADFIARALLGIGYKTVKQQYAIDNYAKDGGPGVV